MGIPILLNQYFYNSMVELGIIGKLSIFFQIVWQLFDTIQYKLIL